MRSDITGNTLMEPGTFVLGCNYWASHAGTEMWVDWRPEIVEQDFKKLEAAGLQVLRLFPIWRDFQPLALLRKGGGLPVEFRFGNQPLPDTEAGRSGVSEEMIARFECCLDLAAKHRLKLIVGIITGFMSGRNFVPPAFEGRDCHTDPEALRWQIRFARYFTRRFRDHRAIIAWDLGNECNWLGGATTADQAYLWTASIANAIRIGDPSRPVGSGMHSLGLNGRWLIRDQAELTDFLTTHPYPFFTPHTNLDPVNTFRACIHATAESRFYADIGRRPILCEELGQLGPCVSSDRIAADFARTTILSLWAHDCHGALWWCAHDQTKLALPPYDWCQLEQELGLLRTDGTPKPVLKAMTEISRFIAGLPFKKLPPRKREAVCILTQEQDHWGVALGAFVLSKQAGYDLAFQYQDEELQSAPVYLLPCIKGGGPLSRRAWLALLERVRSGATLYISLNGGFLTRLEEVAGVEIQTRCQSNATMDIVARWLPDSPAMLLSGKSFETACQLKATRADVLAVKRDGSPAFTCAAYGKGRVFVLACPLEMMLVDRPGVMDDEQALFWKIHECLASAAVKDRAIRKTSAHVGITEHPLANGRQRIAVLINYSPHACEETLQVSPAWKIDRVLRGRKLNRRGPAWQCLLAPNDAAVILLKRNAPIRKS